MIIVVIGELCPNNILNIDLVRELSDEERRQNILRHDSPEEILIIIVHRLKIN